MKKLFLLIAMAVMMCSCGVLTQYTYYQVFKTAPVDSSHISNTAAGVVYEDDNCTIMYSFWSEFGNAGFTIMNKTDQVLVMDMNKSFFILNGLAFNYDVLSNKKEEEHVFRPIVAIPPKAFRAFKPHTICTELFVDCDLDRFPKDSAVFTFVEDSSPLYFTNYITYNLGEGTEELVVENKFYIASVTNYAKPALFDYVLRTTKPCLNKTYSVKKYYSPKYSVKIYDPVCRINTADCFFVKYVKETSQELYKEPMRGYIYSDYYEGYILNTNN